MQPETRRVLSARTAAANRLLDHGRLRVTTWGRGYRVDDGRGKVVLAGDLDELGRTCHARGARLGGWAMPDGPGMHPEEQEVQIDPHLAADLGLVSVWSAYVAHLAVLAGPLRLHLPDADGRALRLDIRPSAVQVEVLQGGAPPATLRGPGAQVARDHLRRYAPARPAR